MKISLLTYGSRGDVEPFASLGNSLSKAGYQVRLAAPETYADLVQNKDVDFLPLPGDPVGLVNQLVDQAGKNPFRMITSMMDFVIPLGADVHRKVWDSCHDSDLIIHTFLTTSTGYELARKLKIPDLSVQFFPAFTSTSELPAPAFPDLPLGPFYRRFTHNLISWIFWNGSQYIYKRIQNINPDLPNLTDWPFAQNNPSKTPIIYAFSPEVVNHPADWGNDVSITGYWISDENKDWKPEPVLKAFLASGPPPVAIAFGSTASKKMGGITQKITQALNINNQRGIFIGLGHAHQEPSPNIISTDYVPYEWLFKHCAVVIHHGGAGTTAKTLWSGIPQIVMPFTSDQPFWARRVHKLGLSPKPIPPKRFPVAKLISAINQTLHDKVMIDIARNTGERIRQENGLEKAVEIIEAVMN